MTGKNLPKGWYRGERHPRAKLTDDEVDLVLDLAEEGWGYGRIAAKFGVGKACVQKIVTGRTRRARTTLPLAGG